MQGKSNNEVIKEDSKYISPSTAREYRLVYRKAKGMHIFDEEGKKYLDFGASIAVMNSGNSNPYVDKAIKEQMKLGLHCGFYDFYAGKPVEFVKKLS